MKQAVRLLLLTAAAAFFLSSSAWTQAIFSTITGLVTDPAGAVIPGAKVTLQNATSGDVRQTVTDAQGLYTFASVPVGSYNLSASHEGFQAFREKGIGVSGGALQSINIALKVGSATETVQVSAAGDILTPVDSGEQAETLTTQQLQNYVQTGSDAAEFIKIMPGFGVQNGVSNGSAYTGEVIGINANGNGGSQSPLNNDFSYDGMPGNTLDIVSDGAHVADPGCDCDTPVNPNSDFLQEFKVLTSDFAAEDQKGPMVITSVTKAGGSQFHGEGFFSARNYELNANDSYNNALHIGKPANKYYYPGGDVGGPVIIPGTNFNHNRDKLFFFAGFEYFYQVLDSGALAATVPTTDMIGGCFSTACLSALGATADGQGTALNPTTTSSWTNGQMPNNVLDTNMQALMKLYPGTNADPATSGGFNYTHALIFNQNNTQLVTRIDYDISQNTKVWARWNWQTEIQPSPLGLWEGSTDAVPYPTDVLGRNRSNSIAATVTHVFSPTLTNEGVFAWTRILFPNVFSNPDAVTPSKIGDDNPTLFAHSTPTNQIQNIGGFNGESEAANIQNQGGFYLGGAGQGLFADKWMPSFSDTVTKVWRTHTFAAGMFYEWIRNSQPDSSNTQGTMTFYPGNLPNNLTYGDAYADMLAGNMSQYSETNFNRLNEISFWQLEAFVQDSWKVKPKLTINYGVRFTHFTPWIDDLGYGFSQFIPGDYSSADNGACAAAPTFCGFEWHSKDSAVPIGGFPTRALFYQPRLGFAYDFRGNGNTVLRGGYGFFYFHTGQFTNGLTTAAGEEGITITPNTVYSNNQQLLAANLGTIGTNGAEPSAPTAVSSSDDKQPYSEEYNLTIEQRTPWSGLFSLAYIGNVSRDLPSNGGYGSDINLIPLGTMSSLSNSGSASPNSYRPYLGYGQLNQNVNNLYSNYNALQAGWNHEGHGMTLQFNYTWAHALGIVGGSTPTLGSYGATLDPFSLQANYGPLADDRRQIFNAVYSFNLPSPIHGNKFAEGVVNGWQLSGLTGLQSGPNLTGNSGYSWHMNLNGSVLPDTINTTQNPINAQSIFGTPDISLMPLVTCNPSSGLAKHQYVNGACFAAPTTVGTGGPTILPTEYGPAYFDSDLGVFKNFQIGSRETNKLQIRAEAQNFLNHPLTSFPNASNLTLNFTQNANTGAITQTNSNFGYAQFTQGHRIVELSAKYYF